MAEQEGRFDWVNSLARLSLLTVFGLLLLSLIATVSLAVIYYVASPDRPINPIHILLVVAELAGILWALLLYGVVGLLVSCESSLNISAGRLTRIETLLESQNSNLQKLADTAALTDQARSILFRDREMETIREAVHDDFMKQDYKSAEALINGLETKFGYTEEAARLREEMQSARKASIDEKIDDAIKRIQAIIEMHDWQRAHRLANRLVSLFQANPKATALPAHIDSEYAKRKRQLLQEYGQAVAKNDIDHGVELLKELDKYLTPQEGAALQESARGVFRAKLHNLGVQFAIGVTDKQWHKAVATGEEIIREFPNSRMAHEVRQKMSQLKARAASDQQKK